MPRVAVVDGVRIEFYRNEHPPPHFHAVIAEYRAVFKIDNLEMTRGLLPRAKERAVRDWASTRKLALLRAWSELRKGGLPEDIS